MRLPWSIILLIALDLIQATRDHHPRTSPKQLKSTDLQFNLNVLETFLDWKAFTSEPEELREILKMEDTMDPLFVHRIARLLCDSFTLSMARQSFTMIPPIVKEILESHNPDVFMQFPRIMEEVARSSNSAPVL